jgi:hypothetical protein
MLHKNTIRRWPFASLEEIPHQQILPDLQPQNCEKTNSYWLNNAVCCVLLWQTKLTNKFAKNKITFAKLFFIPNTGDRSQGLTHAS